MKNKNIHSCVPIGEVKCIWMGYLNVEFKLCDKSYDCDSCEFYEMIRDSNSETVKDGKQCVDTYEMNDNLFQEKLFSILHQLHLEENLFYSQNHTWVKLFDWTKAKVGLDSLLGSLLPDNISIILPSEGNFLKQGQPCCWITNYDSTFTIIAPIDGCVKHTNADLFNKPELISKSPYDEGWLFEIKPSDFDKDKRHLIDKKKMMNVCSSDAKKLEKRFLEAIEYHKTDIGTTLMDGGALITNLTDLVGTKNYNNIISSIF